MKLILFCIVSFANLLSFARLLDYGIPIGIHTNLVVIECNGFTLGYDINNHQSRWACYRLTDKMLDNSSNHVDRTDNFHCDNRIAQGSPTPADYISSGYDRGHLCPANDMSYSKESMNDSFLMTNMSPQTPGFNRGIWKDLESWVRKCAKKEMSLYVITGPIFSPNATNSSVNDSQA